MNAKIDFVNGKTSTGLLQMAVPLMIAMLLTMAYNLVDSLWIGNMLGENAMAALTNATPIILLLTSIGMGATNGLAILLSQAIGAKDDLKAKTILSTSLISSVVFSLVLTVICEFGMDEILRLLKTPASIFPMAKDYISLYMLGFIAVYLYLYFTAVLRSYGNTKFQVMAILCCTLLNTVLDPFFIHMMGFRGAAVATLLSQFIALILMVCYISRKKLFSFSFSLVHWAQEKALLSKALPSVIQQSIPALSTSVLTAIVSGFGVTSIAAYGITGKLETILFYPAMALNMAITAIIGQCVGAGRLDRAKEYLKTSLIYGTGLLVALSLLVVVFSGNLSHLFLNSTETASIVKTYFLIVGVGYILNTTTSCFTGTINGLGKPGMGMYLMIFYYILIRMPLADLLSHTALGLNGVWLAVLISHGVAAISAVVLYRWLLLRTEKPSLVSAL